MSRKLLHQGQILGPGGLPQGVLEQAVLGKLLAGHWSVVAGVHFLLPNCHLVEQVCVQSVVPSSQPQ